MSIQDNAILPCVFILLILNADGGTARATVSALRIQGGDESEELRGGTHSGDDVCIWTEADNIGTQ